MNPEALRVAFVESLDFREAERVVKEAGRLLSAALLDFERVVTEVQSLLSKELDTGQAMEYRALLLRARNVKNSVSIVCSGAGMAAADIDKAKLPLEDDPYLKELRQLQEIRERAR